MSLVEDANKDTSIETEENKALSDEIHQILLRESAKILVDLSRVPGKKVSQNQNQNLK